MQDRKFIKKTALAIDDKIFSNLERLTFLELPGSASYDGTIYCIPNRKNNLLMLGSRNQPHRGYTDKTQMLLLVVLPLRDLDD